MVLDTAVTPELAAEGLARDLIRVVQQARRDADLDVSDRIALIVAAAPAVVAAVEAHRDFVAGETLATVGGVRATWRGGLRRRGRRRRNGHGGGQPVPV